MIDIIIIFNLNNIGLIDILCHEININFMIYKIHN